MNGSDQLLMTDNSEASLPTRFAYGVGSAAFGVKDQGVAAFVLIFYSQVCGLDPLLVGIATTVSLIIDAISDPLVGYYSDTFDSKWGRRHPFMYFSMIPAGVSFYFLWAPPEDMSQMGLFVYLLITIVILRTALTFYETPSVALAPELTSNYEQRSALLAIRTFFGWAAGIGLTIISFMIIFPAYTTDELSGQFAIEAYQIYGGVGAVIMMASILISCLGTHGQIPKLRKVAKTDTQSLPDMVVALREIFSNHSFRAITLSMIFLTIGAGMGMSLSLYFLNFFWQFNETETGIVMASNFLGVIVGTLIARPVTEKFDKRKGAMWVASCAIFGTFLATALRLLGVLPDNGEPSLIFFVIAAVTVDVSVMVCVIVILSSMMADLTEQLEVKSARRSEGLLFSAITFVRKCVGGLGVMSASTVLVLADIPSGATVGSVPEESVQKLGLYYLPLLFTFWGAMIYSVSRYKVTREDHDQALAQLQAVRPRDPE